MVVYIVVVVISSGSGFRVNPSSSVARKTPSAWNRCTTTTNNNDTDNTTSACRLGLTIEQVRSSSRGSINSSHNK